MSLLEHKCESYIVESLSENTFQRIDSLDQNNNFPINSYIIDLKKTNQPSIFKSLFTLDSRDEKDYQSQIESINTAVQMAIFITSTYENQNKYLECLPFFKKSNPYDILRLNNDEKILSFNNKRFVPNNYFNNIEILAKIYIKNRKNANPLISSLKTDRLKLEEFTKGLMALEQFRSEIRNISEFVEQEKENLEKHIMNLLLAPQTKAKLI